MAKVSQSLPSVSADKSAAAIALPSVSESAVLLRRALDCGELRATRAMEGLLERLEVMMDREEEDELELGHSV